MKLKIIVIFFVAAVAAVAYFLVLPNLNQNKNLSLVADNLFGWKFPVAKFPSTGSGSQLTYSNIRDPGGIPQGLPVRLKIPVIGVDSAVEDATITPDGRMDVPAGSVNVAWFSLGPHPGQIGSAVIGGHFGVQNGKPFVFYNLNKLKIGDKMYVVDDGNNTLAFIVRATKLFDRNADATPVFTSSDGLAHLNLITCEGIWNQINGNYPQRLVIFTDAIPPEGAINVKPIAPAIIAAKPKTIPLPAPTPVLLPTPAPIPAFPPTSAPGAVNSSNIAGVLIQSAKNSYATPADGLVTSLLLISIGFTSFKIIKR